MIDLSSSGYGLLFEVLEVRRRTCRCHREAIESANVVERPMEELVFD